MDPLELLARALMAAAVVVIVLGVLGLRLLLAERRERLALGSDDAERPPRG